MRLIDGQLVKLYAIEAPGRRVDAAQQQAALDLAAQELSAGDTCVGLAAVIVHAGGDGDYVIVQSWIADYMTRLAVFVGPADEPQELLPAPPGLGPCVWEAAVLAHERTAFVDHVLAGHGPLQLRLTAWTHDTFAA